jgi:hypothetical protein
VVVVHLQPANVNTCQSIGNEIAFILGKLGWINLKVISGLFNVNALAECLSLIYLKSEHHIVLLLLLVIERAA